MTWLKRSILILIWVEVADAVNLHKSVCDLSHSVKLANYLSGISVNPFVQCEEAKTLAILAWAQASPSAGFPPADLWRWICSWHKATFYALLLHTEYVPKKYLWTCTETPPPYFPYFLFWIAKTSDKTVVLLKVGRILCQNLFITLLALYH